MKIALCQIDPTVGDFAGNTKKITDMLDEAKNAGCRLAVFPELCIMGYPPRDLLLRRDFLAGTRRSVAEIVPHTQGIAALIGSVTDIPDSEYLYNSAVLLDGGEERGRFHKTLLPSYDVFEETRYFQPAPSVDCVELDGMKLAVTVCEDIWNDKDFFKFYRYPRDVLAELSQEKPDLYINLSASPYHYGKQRDRIEMVAHHARKYAAPFLYINQVGGNDELIFDGSSMVLDAKGQLVSMAAPFDEAMAVYDTGHSYAPVPFDEDIGWMYRALVLGVRDYFAKTGFKKTLLGLSGGVDSSLVAAIAADALGPENVLGVSMPSRYSTEHSKDDAWQLAQNLGIEYRQHPIEDVFAQYLHLFNGEAPPAGDLAEENVQARIRGALLMFLSNREGRLLLTTGNKSEIAVGYATLYGDMCGGLAVIGDVPKTLVYALCRWRNHISPAVPENVLTKPPSAELRPDQTDQDSLPPYDVLDRVIHMYVEEKLPVEEIAARGVDRETVKTIVRMIDLAEYKRRQAAPVLKVTGQAFGMGRKLPIAQRFSAL
jgi:NAD+ synthase (glutamine-hydrolysing)